MRENLIKLSNALNAANKAGAFTLQEAIEIINAFDATVKFVGEHTDLSEPVAEVVEEAPKKVRKAKTA